MEREVRGTFPLTGPHPGWSQVSGAGGRDWWAVRLEPVEPGGSGLGEGSWLHLGRRGNLRSENSRISGAPLAADCVAFADKGTMVVWVL